MPPICSCGRWLAPAGTLTRNVEPLPYSLSTATLPPCNRQALAPTRGRYPSLHRFSPSHSLYPVKALEQLRQLIRWNAGAGIGDHKLEPSVLMSQGYLDQALERELKGIGKKIEDDLLLH